MKTPSLKLLKLGCRVTADKKTVMILTFPDGTQEVHQDSAEVQEISSRLQGTDSEKVEIIGRRDLVAPWLDWLLDFAASDDDEAGGPAAEEEKPVVESTEPVVPPVDVSNELPMGLGDGSGELTGAVDGGVTTTPSTPVPEPVSAPVVASPGKAPKAPKEPKVKPEKKAKETAKPEPKVEPVVDAPAPAVKPEHPDLDAMGRDALRVLAKSLNVERVGRLTPAELRTGIKAAWKAEAKAPKAEPVTPPEPKVDAPAPKAAKEPKVKPQKEAKPPKVAKPEPKPKKAATVKPAKAADPKPEKKPKAKNEDGTKHRAGAGCKQPGDVDGFEVGKIFEITKNHGGSWGKCTYKVRCMADGGYKLVGFDGGRKDITEGQSWPYVSEMFTDLMGLRGSDGKPTKHHRMTLKKFFRTA